MHASKIMIEYEDGSQDLATGSNAKQIMEWYNSCQILAIVHGAVYRGPKFEHTISPHAIPKYVREQGF